jgi:hypothetical protein
MSQSKGRKYIIQAELQIVDCYLTNPIKFGYDSALDYAFKRIQDMLRYDVGVVLGGHIEGNKAIFKIKSKLYTQGRWNSFGIITRELDE